MSDLVCDKHQYNGTIIQVRCPICRIEEEKDKERLDWMETQNFVEATRTGNTGEEERPGLIWLINTGKSLRSAIDEAIDRSRDES